METGNSFKGLREPKDVPVLLIGWHKYYFTFNLAYHDVTGLKCIQVIYAIVCRTIRLQLNHKLFDKKLDPTIFVDLHSYQQV